MVEVVKVVVSGARGRDGGIGLPGTLDSNSGFIGPVAIANAARQPLITNASNGAVAANVSVGPSFASVAGTRTSAAPRISGGTGADANFDCFITSNCVARGDTLFRDEFQSMCDFSSPNGAHADFDAFCSFSGAFGMNHARGFQARMKINMTGGALLSEWTGLIVLPIFNGTFDIGQTAGVRVRDVQKDSGAQNLYTAYGLLIDDCPNWGANFVPICSFDAGQSYMAGGIQFGATANLYGGKEVRFNALHANGGIASYEVGGGVVIAAPVGGPGIVNAYANDSGAPRTLLLNSNDGPVIVNGVGPLNGRNMEVQGSFQASGVHADTGTGFYYGDDKVVGARGAPIANATDAATAITRLNDVLSALRAHGLIAA